MDQILRYTNNFVVSYKLRFILWVSLFTLVINITNVQGQNLKVPLRWGIGIEGGWNNLLSSDLLMENYSLKSGTVFGVRTELGVPLSNRIYVGFRLGGQMRNGHITVKDNEELAFIPSEKSQLIDKSTLEPIPYWMNVNIPEYVEKNNSFYIRPEVFFEYSVPLAQSKKIENIKFGIGTGLDTEILSVSKRSALFLKEIVGVFPKLDNTFVHGENQIQLPNQQTSPKNLQSYGFYNEMENRWGFSTSQKNENQMAEAIRGLSPYVRVEAGLDNGKYFLIIGTYAWTNRWVQGNSISNPILINNPESSSPRLNSAFMQGGAIRSHQIYTCIGFYLGKVRKSIPVNVKEDVRSFLLTGRNVPIQGNLELKNKTLPINGKLSRQGLNIFYKPFPKGLESKISFIQPNNWYLSDSKVDDPWQNLALWQDSTFSITDKETKIYLTPVPAYHFIYIGYSNEIELRGHERDTYLHDYINKLKKTLTYEDSKVHFILGKPGKIQQSFGIDIQKPQDIPSTPFNRDIIGFPRSIEPILREGEFPKIVWERFQNQTSLLFEDTTKIKFRKPVFYFHIGEFHNPESLFTFEGKASLIKVIKDSPFYDCSCSNTSPEFYIQILVSRNILNNSSILEFEERLSADLPCSNQCIRTNRFYLK